ncbi:MAG: hypothetical protein AAFV86_24145, partial [Pseudomonadota bacterium]
GRARGRRGTDQRRMPAGGGRLGPDRRGAGIAGVGGEQPDQPGPVARLAEGLRQRFDPRGILNPGRMG